MKGSTVSAPGKAFLCGEYAVTEGARAIVGAIDRRVVASWDGRGGDGYPLGPEAAATLALARARFGPLPQSLALDRRQLFVRGMKLGLGSSAASSVAVAAAAAFRAGRNLREPGIRQQIFDLAVAGHAEIAPDGSGADVATATHGGFIGYRKDAAIGVQVEAAAPPEALILSLIWTGSPVRTSDLLREVKRLRESAPARYRRAMAVLHEGAHEFAEAFSHDKAGAVIEAARAYHEAMKGLGAAAEVPIVDRRLEDVARAAARKGGAAKPCGAGGGDIAIAFFDDAGAAQRFERDCAEAGLQPIKVRWAPEGIRVDAHGDTLPL